MEQQSRVNRTFQETRPKHLWPAQCSVKSDFSLAIVKKSCYALHHPSAYSFEKERVYRVFPPHPVVRFRKIQEGQDGPQGGFSLKAVTDTLCQTQDLVFRPQLGVCIEIVFKESIFIDKGFV